MGDRAILDPRAGGQFTLFFGDTMVEGRYVLVDPPRRLVITWGRGGSADFPPGTSTLEVKLTPEDHGTRVQIVHSGLPSREASPHAEGWRYYLGRLQKVAAGLDPGPQVIPAGP
jgi:uncharacterized protein YndB with AHSA1/START domain